MGSAPVTFFNRVRRTHVSYLLSKLSVCTANTADFQTMAELNLVAKLKNQLKQEKILLWNPPYTEDLNQPGQQHMQVSCGKEKQTKS